jgi:hypothetical protein
MIRLPCKRQICRCPTPPQPRICAFAAALLLTLAGCSAVSVPVLRSRATAEPRAIAATPAEGGDAVAAECERLRAQIRSNQQALRAAPTSSTSPQIVAAEEAKADKRIEDMRTRLDELDCPDNNGTSRPPRLPPLPPAPGAANP